MLYYPIAAIGLTDYLELGALLLVFLLVCVATVFTTKWLGGIQRSGNQSKFTQVLDTIRIAPNKVVQILRIGEKVIAIAVCKDTVTLLGEIPNDQLPVSEEKAPKRSFLEFFEKAAKSKTGTGEVDTGESNIGESDTNESSNV
ncbi:MAG: flagellar biosynthetic protein FliO [Clostridium sp.]|jgi:flagellar protein FliO/FliZ|nr:flagellar biosynthetic protein FliO [Clostridium sp.]